MILSVIAILLQTATPIPIGDYIPTVDSVTLLEQLSTTEAELQIQATQVSVNGDQIYWSNRPLLPSSDELPGVFGHIRWMVSSGGYSLFGVFQPIVISLGVLLTIAVLSILIHYGQILISLVYRFVMSVINTVIRLIPGIG